MQLLMTCWWMPSQSPGCGWPWPTPVQMLCMMLFGVGHPFGQLGSPVLVLPPPSSWCTLRLLAGGAARESDKSLALLCNNWNRCYHHCFHQKSKMQASMKKTTVLVLSGIESKKRIALGKTCVLVRLHVTGRVIASVRYWDSLLMDFRVYLRKYSV